MRPLRHAVTFNLPIEVIDLIDEVADEAYHLGVRLTKQDIFSEAVLARYGKRT